MVLAVSFIVPVTFGSNPLKPKAVIAFAGFAVQFAVMVTGFAGIINVVEARFSSAKEPPPLLTHLLKVYPVFVPALIVTISPKK